MTARVAVIIPACEAQATLMAALASVVAQTHGDWRAVVVSDDGSDYAAFVAGQGLSDPRLGFVSTGRVRSGCHHARNVGLAHVQADFVTWLDADDTLAPGRFASLLPWAARHGAAADNLLCIDAASGVELSRALGRVAEPVSLDLPGFFRLNAPLVPLIRADHVQARVQGVEMSEDVVANMRLIDRIGRLPVLAESSYIYRKTRGSVSNAADSAARFDAAYAEYIARLREGDGFGLSSQGRAHCLAGLEAKRRLNTLFAAALLENPALDFQAFAEAVS